MSSSSSTDFYKVLDISSTATEAQIRAAYKKKSLQTHPDRFPVGSQAQRDATGQFQEVNNAYYVLSDPSRRREYDATRGSGNAGGWWSRARPDANEQQQHANTQFESVFEEMMADETGNTQATSNGRFYGMLGGASGAVMGFIVAVSAQIPPDIIADYCRTSLALLQVQSPATGSARSVIKEANQSTRYSRRCLMPRKHACCRNYCQRSWHSCLRKAHKMNYRTSRQSKEICIPIFFKRFSGKMPIWRRWEMCIG